MTDTHMPWRYAAAPDLLAALEQSVMCLVMASEIVRDSAGYDALCDQVKICHAAIAKAKGK